MSTNHDTETQTGELMVGDSGKERSDDVAAATRMWKFLTTVAASFAIGGGGATYMTHGQVQEANTKSLQNENRMTTVEAVTSQMNDRIKQQEEISRDLIKTVNQTAISIAEIRSDIRSLVRWTDGRGPVKPNGLDVTRKDNP